MTAEAPSILELARNRARNSRATQAEKPRNKLPESDPDLLRVVALVACRDCQHFKPDSINPIQGMGRCQVDADGDRPPWPASLRRCDRFEITRAAVFRIAVGACKSSSVDPSKLTDWLINQGDPDWLTPPTIKRWAQIIAERGYPDER